MREITPTTLTFPALTCGECGIVFAVPDYWIHEREKDGRPWYCPNGHCRHFAEIRDLFPEYQVANIHLTNQPEEKP